MKLFIWDFHGVLEKGNDNAVVEITNRALEHFGYSRRMTHEESEILSGKRWHEYFTFLLPNLDNQIYLNLQSACFDISLNQPKIISNHIKLNDHAEFVLERIAKNNFTQILISNSPPKSLDLFVHMVGIEKYFPAGYRFGIDSHSQQNLTKKECLNNFLQNKSFPEGLISIGDSPGDMALIHNRSEAVGYLYTHPGRTHRSVECQHKIHDLREVLREINVLENHDKTTQPSKPISA